MAPMKRRSDGAVGSAPRRFDPPRGLKLRTPMPAPHHVVRPRLLEALEGAHQCPVTLVVAPAGAGKTTLVAGWVASLSIPTAWLSVDETDRDAVQLWSAVADALNTLSPGCGDRAARGLRRPDGVEVGVGQLIEDLAAAGVDRGVLVMDDVHEVDDEPLAEASLTWFLQSLPDWLRVVLVSRRSPKLPLERMRVRGQLAELSFDELRFSMDEARELMSRLAPMPSEAEIAAAVRRADGWAASLQLAALSARSKRSLPDPAATPAREPVDGPGALTDGAQHGDRVVYDHEDMLVYDYVMREVFAAEDAELVAALVDTSIVEHVNGSLAAALTDRPDAEDLLQLAASRGLFVSRLGSGGWYRVHPLVRAVLHGELSRRPERLASRHERAARWFEVAGEATTALDHLILAGDSRGALRLLAAKHAELYDGGFEATVHRVIAAIPMEVAAGDVDALVDYTWCHLLVSRRRFRELVDQLTWLADRSPVGPHVAARVEVLASAAAHMNGDWARSGALARRALDRLGDGWWRDVLGRFGWNMVAREIALDERWDELSDEVRRVDVMLGRDPHRRLALEGTRALGEALVGRPIDALRVVAGVRGAVDATNLTVLRGELRFAEALARREVADHALALEALEAIVAEPAETLHAYRVLAAAELTMAKLDDRDLVGARLQLDGARVLAGDQPGPGWCDVLARTATRVALAGGEVAEAGRFAQMVVDPFWAAVGQARVELARGDRDAASATLEKAAPRGIRHDVVLSLLRCRLAASTDESIKHLGAAVDVAAANGLLQTVVSEGPEVLDLVEHVAWRVPDAWVDRLRRAATGAAPKPVAEAGDRLHGVDSLTERERDVLRFLPSRLTQQEIASELYVSLNTLKFHLKVIYRKLGVGSRGEAAEVARRLASGNSRS